MDSRYTGQKVDMYSAKRECWFSTWSLYDIEHDKYYVKLKAVRRATWYLCAERPQYLKVNGEPLSYDKLYVLEYGTRLFRDEGEYTRYWKQLKAMKKAKRNSNGYRNDQA